MAKKPNATEFELDVDPAELGLEALDKQLEAEIQADEDMVVDVELKDAKDPKADWVEIFIDEVEGMSNYEVVGVNGEVFRIKRGEPVKVPPSVIEVLKNAIATKTIQSRDPVTGEKRETFRNYSAIPWRKV